METVDLLRELDKIREALALNVTYHDQRDASNAALHCSEVVRSTPLSSKTALALGAVDRLIVEFAGA